MAVIMLVEDELLIAMDLYEMLEQLGHEVDGPYMTVAQAEDALRSDLPDIALLDAQLRDKEVDEVARRLHEAGVPIVFHSGHVREVEYTKRYPGSRFCPKPASPTDIVKAVNQQLDLSKSRLDVT
ncbi:response regulator [Limimaricola pyoseonensis]|nr:response regulator [Limimaricola pyoseonensis]